ncbi:DUF6011 domain-containing protein [Streptomyces sp. NPDC046977]|uniref:DUF6011 domain-containing protein n=1 Tax=Streptomyces sp. NPDC046977 TaxID=3154703 RepID=UPI0033E15666
MRSRKPRKSRAKPWAGPTCGKCDRPLKDPDSLRRGYGPECWRAMGHGRYDVDQDALPLGQDDEMGDAPRSHTVITDIVEPRTRATPREFYAATVWNEAASGAAQPPLWPAPPERIERTVTTP